MRWHSCLPVESSRMEAHASGPGSGSWILGFGHDPGRLGGQGVWFFYLQFADPNNGPGTGEMGRGRDRKCEQIAEEISYLTGKRGEGQ